MKYVQHAIIWVSLWVIATVALLALSEYAEYRLNKSATSAMTICIDCQYQAESSSASHWARALSVASQS